MANVPPGLHSILCAINLSILCKGADVKRIGYDTVLESLLKDFSILEQGGVFASAKKNIKETVFCVAADNLGTHSLGFYRSLCLQVLPRT